MPIRADLLDLVVGLCFAHCKYMGFLVFCSFRGTVNVLGFVLMFLFCSKCVVLFVGFLFLSEQIC